MLAEACSKYDDGSGTYERAVRFLFKDVLPDLVAPALVSSSPEALSKVSRVLAILSQNLDPPSCKELEHLRENVAQMMKSER